MRSDLGYLSTARIYRCVDCEGCPHAPKCLRAGSSVRSIYVNEHLSDYGEKVASLLPSEEGIEFRR